MRDKFAGHLSNSLYMIPSIDNIRILLLIMIAGYFTVQCSSTRKFLETDVVADSEANYDVEEVASTLEGLAKAFHAAVVSGEMGALQAYYPRAAVARRLSPKETGSLPDETIESDMIRPMIDRLKQNIVNIRQDAVAKGLELEAVELIEAVPQPKTDPGQLVDIVSIRIGTRSYEAGIPVTYAAMDNRVYIFEVLFSTDVFRKKE